jgi:hypothetical protein
MTVAMATASGELHGLINVIGNSVAFDDFKNMDPKTKAKCEKDKKEDNRMVKARYINSRGKHERLQKPYCRWSGDPIKLYNLIPGFIYELPMGMVKEVNEKKNVKRSGLVSVDGEPLKRDESPLDKDEYEDNLHQLVPITF